MTPLIRSRGGGNVVKRTFSDPTNIYFAQIESDTAAGRVRARDNGNEMYAREQSTDGAGRIVGDVPRRRVSLNVMLYRIIYIYIRINHHVRVGRAQSRCKTFRPLLLWTRKKRGKRLQAELSLPDLFPHPVRRRPIEFLL